MRQPVSFKANGYRYTIFATRQLIEIYISSKNHCCVCRGNSFFEALQKADTLINNHQK